MDAIDAAVAVSLANAACELAIALWLGYKKKAVPSWLITMVELNILFCLAMMMYQALKTAL